MDKVLVKLKGTKAQCNTLTRAQIAKTLGLSSETGWKLECVYEDVVNEVVAKEVKGPELLDSIIDNSAVVNKEELKVLWRRLL